MLNCFSKSLLQKHHSAIWSPVQVLQEGILELSRDVFCHFQRKNLGGASLAALFLASKDLSKLGCRPSPSECPNQGLDLSQPAQQRGLLCNPMPLRDREFFLKYNLIDNRLFKIDQLLHKLEAIASRIF